MLHPFERIQSNFELLTSVAFRLRIQFIYTNVTDLLFCIAFALAKRFQTGYFYFDVYDHLAGADHY